MLPNGTFRLILCALAATLGWARDRAELQAQALVQYAERAYAAGEFSTARQLFASAATHRPGYIPAEIGLVRLDLLESNRKSARQRLQDLARQHPANRDLEHALNVLSDETQDYAKLTSPYQHYRLPLGMDQRTAQPDGVFLLASINGSRPLRLLLDTGASHILLTPRTATSISLGAVSPASVTTYSKTSRPATIASADVRLGSLTFTGAPVFVADLGLENGIDGLIGTRLFRQFLLKLDVSKRRLDLETFDTTEPWMDHDRDKTWIDKGFEPMYQLGHYLLLNRSGLLLLDTGSNFNTPARLNQLDLQSWIARNGVNLTGVLGFPAIRHAKLTLNYRDGCFHLSD